MTDSYEDDILPPGPNAVATLANLAAQQVDLELYTDKGNQHGYTHVVGCYLKSAAHTPVAAHKTCNSTSSDPLLHLSPHHTSPEQYPQTLSHRSRPADTAR